MKETFFKITSGQIVLSDPCYSIDPPNWCMGVVKAKNGLWDVHVDYDGSRVKSISAWNIEAAQENNSLMSEVFTAGFLSFSFGVDSGQFGYFDRIYYRNDEIITPEIPMDESFELEKNGDKFYSVCCEATSNRGYSVLPFGIVSSSGYGNGVYPTRGIMNADGEYIVLATVFIEDEVEYDDEEFEDEFEDEEIDEE